jgi:hypothetical protein
VPRGGVLLREFAAMGELRRVDSVLGDVSHVFVGLGSVLDRMALPHSWRDFRVVVFGFSLWRSEIFARYASCVHFCGAKMMLSFASIWSRVFSFTC